MGYIFDFNDAKAYERWYEDPENKLVAELETQLMLRMLKPERGDRIIDIGCGTGINLSELPEKGIDISGIDPSPYMLDIAKSKSGNKVDLHRGFAEDLPFDDNSFNHACFITSLEFVENPEKALREACRVAKDRLFIGVLNRCAVKGIQRRVRGLFSKSIYNQASFFTIWELKNMLRNILGDIPITWQSISLSSRSSVLSAVRPEASRFLDKSPFGTYLGIVAVLVPRFKTTPLKLKLKFNLPKMQIGGAPA